MKLFHSKKSKIALAAELIMPWLTLIGSIPAVYWWFESDRQWRIEYNSDAYLYAEGMFDIFYNTAMIIGGAVIAALVAISLISLVLMIISISKKQKCSAVTMLILLVCGIFCSFGTGVFMFFTIVFTYGMGI